MCTAPPMLRNKHSGRGAHTEVAHPECMKMSVGGKRIYSSKALLNLMCGSTVAMEGVPTSGNVCILH